MDADFWHNKWEQNEIGFHLSEANPLLVRYFSALNLQAGQRLFLPLCGKTRDISWLIDAGFNIAGVELNQGAVSDLFTDLAITPKVNQRDDFTIYQAEKITIFVGDFFKLSAQMLADVDAVYDRAALVALPEQMRLRYSQHLALITAYAPQLVVNYHYDQSILNGPPFSVSNEELKQHYEQQYQMQLLEHLDVEGGLKGRCPATENVWLLTKR